MNFVQFPDITPSSMDFVAPRFPVGSETGLSGASSRRRFGNKQYDGRLTVEFRNISNTVCAEILTIHANSKGLAPIAFNDSFFSGAGPDLKPFFDCSVYPGLLWFFIEDSPPRINRVEGGAELSNVSIEFAAKLISGFDGSSGGGGGLIDEGSGILQPIGRGVLSVRGEAPINSSGGTDPIISISPATQASRGSMSASDKLKLDGIEAGAQVNVPTDLSYTPLSRLLESSTGEGTTLPIFSSLFAGLVPESTGGTTNFLRADGTWAQPPGGGGGGDGLITVSSSVTTYVNTVVPTTLIEVNPQDLVYDADEDEGQFEMSIGFPFQLFGQTYTSVNIYSNSFFTFGTPIAVDYGYDSFTGWITAYPVPGVYIGTYDGRMKEIYATQLVGAPAPGPVGQRECTIRFIGSQNYSDSIPDLEWEITLKEDQPNKIFLKILQFNDNGGTNGVDLFSFATTGRLSVPDSYTAFNPNVNTDYEITLARNIGVSDYSGSRLVILDSVDSLSENAETESVDVQLGYLKSNTDVVENSGKIVNIVSISQADYDAIVTKDPQTLYIIP